MCWRLHGNAALLPARLSGARPLERLDVVVDVFGVVRRGSAESTARVRQPSTAQRRRRVRGRRHADRLLQRGGVSGAWQLDHVDGVGSVHGDVWRGTAASIPILHQPRTEQQRSSVHWQWHRYTILQRRALQRRLSLGTVERLVQLLQVLHTLNDCHFLEVQSSIHCSDLATEVNRREHESAVALLAVLRAPVILLRCAGVPCSPAQVSLQTSTICKQTYLYIHDVVQLQSKRRRTWKGTSLESSTTSTSKTLDCA